MPPDVIDLISSSPVSSSVGPSASTSHAFEASQPSPTRHEPGPNTSPRHRGRISSSRCDKQALPDGVQHIAKCIHEVDDIDEPDDLDVIFDLVDDRQTKRRRVVERDDTQTTRDRPISSILSQPSLPLKEQKNRRQNRAVLEPIEFTSSLGPVSPAKENFIDKGFSSDKFLAKKAVGNSVSEDPIACFSSDPFASSPLPLSERSLAGRRAVSLDQCRSSPPSSLTTSRARNTDAEHDKGGGPSARRTATSRQSAIEVREDVDTSLLGDVRPHGRANESAGLADLITIDDSDSSSDSNDDLPAISEMDVSKRRARSPLRRTQSDLTWSGSRSRTSYLAASTNRAKPKKTAHERELEKARKRQEREEAKAAKAAEKQRAAALVEVNKLRTDKKVSTPEMIVDLSSGLGSELRIQVQEMLQGLGVDHTTWNGPEHSIVKWRRKVTSKYNHDIGLWEPIPARIVDEEIALVIVAAEDFVAMALDDLLATHVADIKSHHGNNKFVYLVQGMTPWLRRNRNNRNRRFASGVRSTNAAPSSSRASGEHISEDVVEDAMLALQVEHGMLIHHTAVAIDTARWVINFTQHVSTIPYRMQRDQATSGAGFCMESGQVRTGDSAKDTYVRMLQEIMRVTAPIAHGIAAEFDSVTKLVQGLERGGPDTLDSVRKSANKDGAVSDRTLGQAISQRIYKVFTGTDEGSSDI
ncbi:ERCC4 domain protein [Metarhizium album ARSEF 1941]|uniref:ERCC4 domain protein n=1 Tax=Metarhizium album (strain ARSEF 1941) TaxID=1081103 RepID=A0A0B2WPH6_METAS|nr:ERCC4 domain protein [Metarhizium album ARSEF 1941]KHN95549.1 ERCC4 domain protein [Metarhizium album ARSEF 1941]